MKNIFVHGSGHKSASWNETISYMENNEDILCPNLSSILNGKEADYHNLYSSFKDYCNSNDGQINLCGISLGGILALNYTLDFPDKVKSLVLIGTPHKIPKVMFSIQNMIFRFLPKSMFDNMAFNKKDTFILGNSMKELDFSSNVNGIKCPTLVICGKKDSANIKSAYYLSENIPGAKLEIIENTGHVVNEENPEILAKILSDYYKSISGT
ncbi:MAG: alpha/beta fold hydrolase [Eubacteriales bacterium]|nr:alpha/beta fold hydrolase [Eubacteriales bacterium]